MLVKKASNSFIKTRNLLARAAPVIHSARRIGDAVGAVASAPGISAIPGAGVVSSLAKGLGMVDNLVQKAAVPK